MGALTVLALLEGQGWREGQDVNSMAGPVVLVCTSGEPAGTHV